MPTGTWDRGGSGPLKKPSYEGRTVRLLFTEGRPCNKNFPRASPLGEVHHRRIAVVQLVLFTERPLSLPYQVGRLICVMIHQDRRI